MEKASYGTLWTIKPHLRETKGGKISSVKGFQQKRLRFKPGYRVIRHDAKAGIHRFTQQGFPVMGTVVNVKELTAKVKWDAGRTVEEPYNNLKLAKSQTPNAPELGMKERGYRRRLGIHRPATSKVQHPRLRRPPTPLSAPVSEGATKSIILEELSAMKKSDRKNKVGEFYVILQKAQVRVKPYQRRGKVVTGYQQERKLNAEYTDMKAYPPQHIQEMSTKELLDARKRTGNFNVLAHVESELMSRGKLRKPTAGLKVGESQEPYSRKLTFESGQKLRGRDKVAKQVEENFTKPVKFLKPETKKSVNSQLHALGTYHDAIPMKDIGDILERHGLKILQEDRQEHLARHGGGFFLGDSSHTSFSLAAIGSKKAWTGSAIGRTGERVTMSVPDSYSYEPAKNTVLNLSWYKMGSGRYEIIAYLA